MSTDPSDALDLARQLSLAAAGGLRADEAATLLARVDALLAAHQDRVYGLCLRFTGNPEQARDLAQDALLRAFQKLPEFRGEARFSTWLLGIARYECLNALRKRGELLTEDGVIEAPAGEVTTLRRLRHAERDALLREAAAAVLDPLEQEAVHLRYVEHLPLARIEELLDVPGKSGARGLLQGCRRKLGRELQRRLALLGHGVSFFQDSVDR